jgi:uncharacterized OsmC-like protein
MAGTTIQIRNIRGTSLAVGASGGRTVTIDRAESAGGLGLGFNGGELLLLALGACFSNDIFREASKKGIAVKDVRVQVSADWDGDPVVAQNVTMSVEVDAEADENTVRELVEHTNNVAEIPNTLRVGREVRLESKVKALQR